MSEELFVSQEDVDAVAELLSCVSWDEVPDTAVGIDDTDDDDESDAQGNIYG